MNVEAFMLQHSPDELSIEEVDVLVRPYYDQIGTLMNKGYSGEQIRLFMSSNGVSLKKHEILLSCVRIEEQLERSAKQTSALKK